jgi:multisubunit Na+/H+ antiporter MnhE subunit
MMRDTLKDWLPITKRNRVALGFAIAALVMFVMWNLLPAYEMTDGSFHELVRSGWFFQDLWPEVVDLNGFLDAFYSPSSDGFIDVFLSIAYLMNALTVLFLVPFWKFLHASRVIRVVIFIPNFLGALIKVKQEIEWHFVDHLVICTYPFHQIAQYLMIFCMLAVSGALLIFKNELGLRDELEVKKMMAGD